MTLRQGGQYKLGKTLSTVIDFWPRQHGNLSVTVTTHPDYHMYRQHGNLSVTVTTHPDYHMYRQHGNLALSAGDPAMQSGSGRGGQRGLLAVVGMLIVFLDHWCPCRAREALYVAAGKPAVQSSQEGKQGAELAVDGDTTNTYLHCQHTALAITVDHWWMVDLKGFYDVRSVTIFNPATHGERLRNFDVEVFMVNPLNDRAARAHLCYHEEGPVGSGEAIGRFCYRLTRGRYVRIFLPGNTTTPTALHVCEVGVYGYVPDLTSTKYAHTADRKAGGVLLQSVTVPGATRCLLACDSHLACSAVNLAPPKPSTRRALGGVSTLTRVCELLTFGGINQPSGLVRAHAWDFYAVTDY
ncbi:uncharacterized protein LOC143296608 [Babylonia areolata]|uniref:uncharacterized protein LOC143296608 n=1 Tax=Babylonia areolata TaxID=304850 RepID=UPI003FCF91BD